MNMYKSETHSLNDQQTLATLDLRYTGINDEAAQQLGAALGVNSVRR